MVSGGRVTTGGRDAPWEVCEDLDGCCEGGVLLSGGFVAATPGPELAGGLLLGVDDVGDTLELVVVGAGAVAEPLLLQPDRAKTPAATAVVPRVNDRTRADRTKATM